MAPAGFSSTSQGDYTQGHERRLRCANNNTFKLTHIVEFRLRLIQNDILVFFCAYRFLFSGCTKQKVPPCEGRRELVIDKLGLIKKTLLLDGARTLTVDLHHGFLTGETSFRVMSTDDEFDHKAGRYIRQSSGKSNQIGNIKVRVDPPADSLHVWLVTANEDSPFVWFSGSHGCCISRTSGFSAICSTTIGGCFLLAASCMFQERWALSIQPFSEWKLNSVILKNITFSCRDNMNQRGRFKKRK